MTIKKMINIIISIIVILSLSFYVWITDVSKNTTAVTKTFLSCQVGECATNIYNGEKRCSANSAISVVYDPTFEVCNSMYSCDNTVTPYAVNTDGSTNIFGICDSDAQGNPLPCRCVSTKYCATEVLNKINQIIPGTVETTGIGSSSITTPQTFYQVPYDSDGLCGIKPIHLDRMSPRTKECTFNLQDNPSPLELYRALVSNPCDVGVLAFHTSPFDIRQYATLPVACLEYAGNNRLAPVFHPFDGYTKVPDIAVQKVFQYTPIQDQMNESSGIYNTKPYCPIGISIPDPNHITFVPTVPVWNENISAIECIAVDTKDGTISASQDLKTLGYSGSTGDGSITEYINGFTTGQNNAPEAYSVYPIDFSNTLSDPSLIGLDQLASVFGYSYQDANNNNYLKLLGKLILLYTFSAIEDGNDDVAYGNNQTAYPNEARYCPDYPSRPYDLIYSNHTSTGNYMYACWLTIMDNNGYDTSWVIAFVDAVTGTIGAVPAVTHISGTSDALHAQILAKYQEIVINNSHFPKQVTYMWLKFVSVFYDSPLPSKDKLRIFTDLFDVNSMSGTWPYDQRYMMALYVLDPNPLSGYQQTEILKDIYNHCESYNQKIVTEKLLECDPCFVGYINYKDDLANIRYLQTDADTLLAQFNIWRNFSLAFAEFSLVLYIYYFIVPVGRVATVLVGKKFDYEDADNIKETIDAINAFKSTGFNLSVHFSLRDNYRSAFCRSLSRQVYQSAAQYLYSVLYDYKTKFEIYGLTFDFTSALDNAQRVLLDMQDYNSIANKLSDFIQGTVLNNDKTYPKDKVDGDRTNNDATNSENLSQIADRLHSFYNHSIAVAPLDTEEKIIRKFHIPYLSYQP